MPTNTARPHIQQLQEKIKLMHEGKLAQQNAPANFYDLHDAQKKKIRKLRHDLHIGVSRTLHQAVKVENNTLRLDFDAGKNRPPVSVNYLDKNGKVLAVVYHNGTDIFIHAEDKNAFEGIQVNFKGNAAAQSLYFDHEKTALSLSGDLSIADTLFVNASGFHAAGSSSISAGNLVVKADAAMLDGDLCAGSAIVMARDFVNQGKLQANTRLELTGGQISNKGKIEALGEYVTSCTDYQNQGEVHAGSAYFVKCSGSYDNTGTINADDYSHIAANDIKLNGRAYFRAGFLAAPRINTARNGQVECGDFLYLQGKESVQCKGIISARTGAETGSKDMPVILIDSPAVNMDRAAKLGNESGEILVHSENQLRLNASIKARNVWLDSDKNVSTTPRAKIEAQSVTCAGDEIQLNNQFDNTGAINLTAQGKITLNTSDIKADKAELKAPVIVTAAGSRIAVKEAKLDAGHISLDGNVMADSLQATSADRLTVQPGFSGDINECTLHCSSGSFSGRMEKSGQVAVQARNNFHLAKSSHINFRNSVQVRAGNEVFADGNISNDKEYAAQHKSDAATETQQNVNGFVDIHARKTVVNGQVQSYSALIRAEKDLLVTDKAEVNTDSTAILAAENVRNKGMVHSLETAAVNAGNLLRLDPESVLYAKAACDVSANEMQMNGADIDSGYLRVTADQVNLDDFARIQCKNDFIVKKAKLFRSDNASVRAANVLVDAHSYYAKSGSIRADDTVKVTSGNYYNDVPVDARNIHLEVNDNIEFGKNSHLEASGMLKIEKSSGIVNRGTNVAHHSLDIDIKGDIVNHEGATIVLQVPEKNKEPEDEQKKTPAHPPFMRINAESIWNTGKINGNVDYPIALNKVFVNGFTEWSSLGDVARGCLNASVGGKSVSIVAGATMSVGGELTGDLNISSFANIILGLNKTWNMNVNSLLSIDSGVVLPNPAKLGHYLKSVASCNFSEIGSAIFTLDNAMTALNLLITALKVMVPQVGVGLGIAWNVILLARQLPMIISMCKSLYDKGRNVQLRDVIPLIVLCKSAAMQAANTVSMGMNYANQFMTQDHGFAMPDFASHFDAKSLMQVASSVAMVLAPGVREDSLVSIGLPRFVLAGNTQTMSALNFTTPGSVEIAGVISKNFIAAQQMGVMLAKTLTLEGQYLRLGGKVHAEESYVSARILETIDKMKFEHAYISADELRQKADLVLAKSQVKVAGTHSVETGAKLDMSETAYDAEKTTVAGAVNADSSMVKAGNFNLVGEGKADVASSRFDAENLSEEQKAVLNFISSDVTVSDTAKIDGQAGFAKSTVTVKNTVISDTGKTAMDEVLFRGDNFTTQGRSEIKNTDFKVTNIKGEGKAVIAFEDSVAEAVKLEMSGHSSLTALRSKVQATDIHEGEDANLDAQESEVHAEHDAVLLGGVNGRDAVISARNDIKVGASARLKVKDVSMQAEHDIDYQGKADVEGVLVLEARHNLDTGLNSSISGDAGTAVLKSEGGSLRGAVTTGTALIDNKELSDYMSLLRGEGDYAKIQPKDMLVYNSDRDLNIGEIHRDTGISVTGSSINITGPVSSDKVLAFTSTQGNLAANANMSGKQGLYLSSAKDLTTGKYTFTSDSQTVLSAKGNYTNDQGTVSGAQTFISADGNVRNVGGTVKGTVYLQVDAGGSIYNTCTETTYRGAYDTMKSWQPGQFIGGTGDGYDKVGVVLYAKDKVYNDASVVAATGDTAVYGENGIESTYRSHEYVSYHKKKSSGFLHHKKEETTVVSTQIQQPVFGSTDGRVVLYSQNGPVQLTATQLLSSQGSDIYSNKTADIMEAIIESRTYKNSSSWWGLSHDKETQRHENSVPTRIANIDPGLTRIHSATGDVNMRGTVLVAPGRTEISAAGKVNITAQALNHEIIQEHSGISISAFGIPIVGGGSGRPLINPDPTVTHIEGLANSGNTGELALNTVSTLTEMSNTINSVTDALEGRGNLLSTAASRYLGMNFSTSVTIGYGKSKTEQRYQTPEESGVFTDQLYIKAGNEVNITGVPVWVSGDMKVDAPKFTQNDLLLGSSLKSKQSSWSVTFTPDTIFKPDVGYTEGRSSMHSTQHMPQQLYVGGNLEVNAHDWSMNGARADVGSLSGHVVNLYGVTPVNHFDAKNEFVSVNTNGNVAYQKGKSEAETIAPPTELHVRGDLTKDKFKVDHIELTGAKITAEGQVDLDAEMKIFDVRTYSKTESSGFAMNVKQAGHAAGLFDGKNASQYGNLLNPDAQPNQRQIDVARYNQSYESVQGVQHGVVFGGQGTHLSGQIAGNLHTQSANGSEITDRKSFHYNAEIPIPGKDTLNLLDKSLAIVTGQHFASDNTSALFRDVDRLLGITDKSKAAAEVRRLGFLANAVYDEDLGQSKAAERGLILVGKYEKDETSTHIAVYIDPVSREAYITFRGVDGVKSMSTDGYDIMTGQTIRSTQDPGFSDFINNQIKTLESQNYSICLTGHSRGAAQASIVSESTDLPAIVFDSTGLPASQYELPQVMSMQSSPNAVNSFSKPAKDGYVYGESVWLLPETPADSLKNIALSAASTVPGLDILSGLAYQKNAHSMDKIEDRVDASLNGASGTLKDFDKMDIYAADFPQNQSIDSLGRMQGFNQQFSSQTWAHAIMAGGGGQPLAVPELASPAAEPHLYAPRHPAATSASTTGWKGMNSRFGTFFHHRRHEAPPDLVTELPLSKSAVELQKEANRFGYDLQDVSGDGWCFFHAVRDQLRHKGLYQEFTPSMLLETAVTHMRKYREHYAPFYHGNLETYFTQLKAKKVWPDEYVLRALSRELGLTLAIVRSDHKQPTIIKPETSVATLYLGYQVDEHYQSLLPRQTGLPDSRIAACIANTESDSFMSRVPDRKLRP